MSNFSKENVLVLPEILKNRNFVKGKCPSFARILEKISTLLKENPLKIHEFLRHWSFFKRKSSKNV
jgi:hypothetical protein